MICFNLKKKTVEYWCYKHNINTNYCILAKTSYVSLLKCKKKMAFKFKLNSIMHVLRIWMILNDEQIFTCISMIPNSQMIYKNRMLNCREHLTGGNILNEIPSKPVGSILKTILSKAWACFVNHYHSTIEPVLRELPFI